MAASENRERSSLASGGRWKEEKEARANLDVPRSNGEVADADMGPVTASSVKDNLDSSKSSNLQNDDARKSSSGWNNEMTASAQENDSENRAAGWSKESSGRTEHPQMKKAGGGWNNEMTASAQENGSENKASGWSNDMTGATQKNDQNTTKSEEADRPKTSSENFVENS